MAIFLLGGITVVAISMAVGVTIGLYKARFSYQWGENYERNFIGAPGWDKGMMFGGSGCGDKDGKGYVMHGMRGGLFRNSHGLSGSVLSVSENSIVLKDKNNQENVIAISEDTLIKFGGETVAQDDLREGDRVVVLGKPGDDGMVHATLIRIFNRSGE